MLLTLPNDKIDAESTFLDENDKKLPKIIIVSFSYSEMNECEKSFVISFAW